MVKISAFTWSGIRYDLKKENGVWYYRKSSEWPVSLWRDAQDDLDNPVIFEGFKEILRMAIARNEI